MKKELLENNYVVIDKFISEKKAKELYKNFKLLHFLFPNDFANDDQCPLSYGICDAWIFLELLIEKCSFMSKFMEEPMFPTYTYARIYSKNEILKKHTDRPACEVSVTLNLGGDKDWPIWFTKPNGETVSVTLKPGQGVIYLGCISEHWREPFEGSECGQVFLHYVRARGSNRWAYFDKRR
jgi:hypothetical protein